MKVELKDRYIAVTIRSPCLDQKRGRGLRESSLKPARQGKEGAAKESAVRSGDLERGDAETPPTFPLLFKTLA